jgi:hypothetical protein
MRRDQYIDIYDSTFIDSVEKRKPTRVKASFVRWRQKTLPSLAYPSEISASIAVRRRLGRTTRVFDVHCIHTMPCGRVCACIALAHTYIYIHKFVQLAFTVPFASTKNVHTCGVHPIRRGQEP